MSKTNGKTVNNQIEESGREQQEIARDKNNLLTPHLNKSCKTYINNLPTPSLSNPLGKHTTQKYTTNQ